MDSSFALKSHLGDFDLTPDRECMMVYVEQHRNDTAPQVDPTDLPGWCFKPETIWFYFGAPESEDKVSAGEKIKTQLLEELTQT
jgi:hypothetical protein